MIVILAIAGIAGSEALAERAQHRGQGHQKAKSKQVAPMSPLAGLNLSGIYKLISVDARLVRDTDLLKSKVTFLPDRGASFTTACNTIGSTLKARAASDKIVSFEFGAQTVLPCLPGPAQGEATINRIIRETANIARAGDTITFFNARGQNIAQWMRVFESQSRTATNEASPTSIPAPINTNILGANDIGDYVLTQIGSKPVKTLAPQVASTPAGLPPVSKAARLRKQPQAFIVSTLPTLFLRANGVVSGSSGCNQYDMRLVPRTNANAGSFFGERPILTEVSEPLTASKKACLNRGTSELEAQLFGALRTAATVSVNVRHINLLARNGSILAQFTAISARPQASPRGRPASHVAGSPALYGTKWILRSLNGTPTDGGNPPSITMSASQASGSTGCNRFEVQHRRANNISRFSGGMMTEMACMDNGRNVLERRYMDAVLASTSLAITGNKLTMRSSSTRNVLIFEAE